MLTQWEQIKCSDVDVITGSVVFYIPFCRVSVHSSLRGGTSLDSGAIPLGPGVAELMPGAMPGAILLGQGVEN